MNFGGGQGSTGVTSSLTGVLGTFTIGYQIDLANPFAFSLSNFFTVGDFSVDVSALSVVVPDVVNINASGIKIAYDRAGRVLTITPAAGMA